MFNDKNLFDFYDVMDTQKRSDSDLNSKYSSCTGNLHVIPLGNQGIQGNQSPGEMNKEIGQMDKHSY